MSGQSLIVRRATCTDYAAVLDINPDVYAGGDYLPACYFLYLNDPHHLVYVMEEDGLLVSLVVYKLSEDGALVEEHAVRVRPSHQGRGLSAERNPLIRAALLRHWPDVTRKLYSARADPKFGRKFSESTVLSKWQYLAIELSPDNCRRFAGRESRVTSRDDVNQSFSYSASVDWLTQTDAIDDLLRGSYGQTHIPVGCDWCPLELTKPALKLLLGKYYICSTLTKKKKCNQEITAIDEVRNCEEDRGDITNDVIASENRLNADVTLDAMSHSETLRQNDPVANIYFCGSDREQLVGHVRRHVFHSLTVSHLESSGKVRYVIHFPLSMEYEGVAGDLERLMGAGRSANEMDNHGWIIIGITPI